MAFDRPSLRELISQMLADAEREAGATQLRQSNLRVLPKVFAFAVHGLYAYIDWVVRQLFPDTAEKSFLERQASIQGIYRREATAATGTLTVTRTAGATIPVGTVFVAADGETRYSTTEEPEVEENEVSVQCMITGTGGNREAGETYSLVSPLSGVSTEATGSEMAGGTEAESDDSLRDRLIYRLQNPPRGGTATDYVAWAMEVPGVTRAWCFPKELGIFRQIESDYPELTSKKILPLIVTAVTSAECRKLSNCDLLIVATLAMFSSLIESCTEVFTQKPNITAALELSLFVQKILDSDKKTAVKAKKVVKALHTTVMNRLNLHYPSLEYYTRKSVTFCGTESELIGKLGFKADEIVYYHCVVGTNLFLTFIERKSGEASPA